MKRTFTLASALTASLMFSNGLAFAQKSARPKGKISVAEILDKHVSAMGGTDKLRTLHSFHARGVFGLELACLARMGICPAALLPELSSWG